eukprot:14496615-Heterocapsa_arctica.AAC.1
MIRVVQHRRRGVTLTEALVRLVCFGEAFSGPDLVESLIVEGLDDVEHRLRYAQVREDGERRLAWDRR